MKKPVLKFYRFTKILNSPYAEQVKKLVEVYNKVKGLNVDGSKPDTVAEAIKMVNDFITLLTEFAANVARKAAEGALENGQQADGGATPAPAQQNNGQQQQANAGQQPAAPGAENASMDYSTFSNLLHENLQRKVYEKAMWRQR